MDSEKVWLICAVVLGLLVVADSIWFILTPPYGDEPQGLALIAFVFFIFLMGYSTTRQSKKTGQ
jgi:hypothetical protein